MSPALRTGAGLIQKEEAVSVGYETSQKAHNAFAVADSKTGIYKG